MRSASQLCLTSRILMNTCCIKSCKLFLFCVFTFCYHVNNVSYGVARKALVFFFSLLADGGMGLST